MGHQPQRGISDALSYIKWRNTRKKGKSPCSRTGRVVTLVSTLNINTTAQISQQQDKTAYIMHVGEDT